MTTARVRGILAIIVVVGALFFTATLFILPLAGGVPDPEKWTQAAKDFGGIFSGVVGTIIGWYFGKPDG